MVWLVSQGEYSDYWIVHAFSDEEKATEHVEEWNALHTRYSIQRRVEPHEISTEIPELAVMHYAEWWSHHGDIYNGAVYAHQDVIEVDEHIGQLDHLNARNFDDGNVSFQCSSLHPERATEIVADARAKFLAEG